MRASRKLLHQEMVADDHRCSVCGKDKTNTEFSVVVDKKQNKAVYVYKICNTCVRGERCRYQINQKNKRRQLIKQKIDKYFENTSKRPEPEPR